MSETAVAPITGPRGVALRDTADIERFANLVYKSTLVPTEYRNKLADVFGVIAFGLELGLNPMQSLQNIAWINSKPSVYGDMLLGLVEASGLLEAFEEVDPDEALRTGIGRCTLKRRGRPSITRTFTREMAETAKLWGKNTWALYPGRMLQMRARSWALRDAFSDVLKGLYAREEAEDIVLTMDPKGTYRAAQAPPEPQELTVPFEALAEHQEPTVGEHPTAEQVNSLVELIRAGELDVVVEMHAQLNLPPEVKITKRLIRETMTMEQYEKAWLFYSHQLKEQIEDDVGDFSGPSPDPATLPQHDTQEQAEGISGSTDNASLTEAASSPTADSSDAAMGGPAPLLAPASAGTTGSTPGVAYASVEQKDELERLARLISPDEAEDVKKTIDRHRRGLPLEMFHLVHTRLKNRLAQEGYEE